MKPKSLKRIGNLELRPASYLLPKDKWPEHGSWHIDYWYPNPYYGHEDDYDKDGDWYHYKNLPNTRVHKDCFKHKQSCFTIASFDYNKEGYYKRHFIGNRPLNITKEEREIFWELLQYGDKVLNKNKEEDD